MKDKEYNIQQLMNDPTFVQWAMGEAEGATTEKWNKWVKQSEKNRKKASRAQKKITGIRFKKPDLPELKQEWQKVKRDILLHEHMQFSDKVRNQTSKNRFWNYLFKVAAVLLVGAFVSYGVYVYEKPVPKQEPVSMETITTGLQEKKTVILPSGSKIILAADSRLSYRSNWLNKEMKHVKLNGEAYFSITPGKVKSKPKFIVETEDGKALVWGTRFTVDTFGAGTQVVLEEGEVQVQVQSNDDSKLAKTTIKPGQMARYSGSKSLITVEKVNPKVYTSWTTNELYFDETPFSVLVNRIERTYDVQVQIKDLSMLDTKISGSIDFRSLRGLIDAVSEVMDVRIEKSNQTLIIGKS